MKKFSTKDGLPTLEVYYVHEDRKGYLWFCTDHGLVRYNGYDFKIFTEKDGLTNNTILSIHEDSKGHLWLFCLNAPLTYYDGQHFQPFSPDEYNAREYIGGEIKLLNDTLVMRNVTKNKTYLARFPDTFEEDNPVAHTTDILGNHYLLEKNNVFFIYITTEKSISGQKRINHTKQGIWINSDIHYRSALKISQNRIFLHNNRNLLLTVNDSIYYQGSLDIKDKPVNILTVYKDNSDILWMATNNGLYTFDPYKAKITGHYFPNEFICSIIQDTDGNYWLATRDNGIWLMPSFPIRTIRPGKIARENKFTSLKTFNDILYAADISGQVYMIGPNYQLLPQLNKEILKYHGIFESEDFHFDTASRNFYIGKYPYIYNQNTHIISKPRYTLASMKTMLEIDSNTVLVGTGAGGFTINSDFSDKDQKNSKRNKSEK
ncbi:MAG: hypothetical protein GKR88_03700 [Flavobacteriaceae bacterium]|nr:MAG: hypothetical protein GKR88_03700 [Flavobacteriaceae bacterium]